MIKLWLVIKDIDTKWVWTKYFENELEMNNYKNKIMNIDKIYEYKHKLQKELTFEEISKLYREVLYDEYAKTKDHNIIHCYQLLRDLIDIFTQMTKGRHFDQKYLEDKIRW